MFNNIWGRKKKRKQIGNLLFFVVSWSKCCIEVQSGYLITLYRLLERNFIPGQTVQMNSGCQDHLAKLLDQDSIRAQEKFSQTDLGSDRDVDQKATSRRIINHRSLSFHNRTLSMRRSLTPKLQLWYTFCVPSQGHNSLRLLLVANHFSFVRFLYVCFVLFFFDLAIFYSVTNALKVLQPTFSTLVSEAQRTIVSDYTTLNSKNQNDYKKNKNKGRNKKLE